MVDCSLQRPEHCHVSFLVSSYISRLDYKQAMLVLLYNIAIICRIISNTPGFLAVLQETGLVTILSDTGQQ